MEPIISSTERIRDVIPAMAGPSSAVRVGEYGVCVAMALAYFGSRLQGQKDILCTACAAISAHALQINASFVGRAAALVAGCLGANHFSLGNLTGALGSVSAYCYLQAGAPYGLPISVFVGSYAGKELDYGSYVTAGTAAAFLSLIKDKYYRVIALATAIYSYASRKYDLSPVISSVDRSWKFLCSHFGAPAALMVTGGAALTALYKGPKMVSSLIRIAVIRSMIFILGVEAAYRFYHASYCSKRDQIRMIRMQNIFSSSPHTWIMADDLSCHLEQATNTLKYVVYSSRDQQIVAEANILLPSGHSVPQAISYLRNCYLELIPGVGGRMSPRFSPVNKVWEFACDRASSFQEARLGLSLADRITGIISLHSRRLENGTLAYQWRWGDRSQRYSSWTDPFIPIEDNTAWHDWWPTSELISRYMVWPDENDIVSGLRNHVIEGLFSSWRGIPALRQLEFQPKDIPSKYSRSVRIDPDHFAVTLVSSGTRSGDPASWGGHAKVAIEYLDKGEHAVRYIHFTVRDGVVHHHCQKIDFKKYSIKTNTVRVSKSLIKAAMAVPPPVVQYSPCGGRREQKQDVTHNCYTYCVDFLRRLGINVRSGERMNVPNLLIPFQELRASPQ